MSISALNHISKRICATIIVTSLLIYLLFPYEYNGKLISSTLVGLTLFQIYRFYKFREYGILFIYLFTFNYSWVIFCYYFFGDPIIIYRVECETPNTRFHTCLYLLIFLSSMSFLINPNKEKQYVPQPRKNKFGYILCLLLAFVFIATGRTGQTIMDTGGYAESFANRESNGLFGYSLIPLSISLLYADTKKKLRAVYLLCLIFIFKDFLYGGRIDSIMLVIIVFLYKFQRKVTAFQFVGLVVIAYIVVFALGEFRSDTSISILGTVESTVNDVDSHSSHAGNVYYASMRILYLIDSNILTTDMRLTSFILYLLSIVIPYSMLPPLANLSSFMMDFYDTGGGGLAPIFYFAFLGIAGVICAGLLHGYIIKTWFNKKSYVFYYYGLLFVATTPRWYAYYPIHPFKFCVYGALFFYVLNFINRKIVVRGRTLKDRKS